MEYILFENLSKFANHNSHPSFCLALLLSVLRTFCDGGCLANSLHRSMYQSYSFDRKYSRLFYGKNYNEKNICEKVRITLDIGSNFLIYSWKVLPLKNQLSIFFFLSMLKICVAINCSDVYNPMWNNWFLFL